MNATTITIRSKATGNTFNAMVFDTHFDAMAYAVAHPVLMRNASGSQLRHSAPIHKLSSGRFAVVC